MNTAQRGEVWLVDLGEAKGDHEQAGKRPAITLQTNHLNSLNTVVVVPLTTNLKRSAAPYVVVISAQEGGQAANSLALCHQVRALDRRKLVHKIGVLKPERLSEVELAILFVFGIAS